MNNDVLLAVDLNHHESWDAAMPEAAEIAGCKGGKMHVMVVVPDFGMAIVGEFFPEDFEQKALAKAREELTRLAEERMPDGVEWDVHIGHGDIAHEILRVAEELDVCMIVMASHPPDRVRHFLVGSQAERVVARAPMSVLVVRS